MLFSLTVVDPSVRHSFKTKYYSSTLIDIGTWNWCLGGTGEGPGSLFL